MARIEERLWLDIAKRLPVGDDIKVIHKGCGQRESLFIKNEADSWWCFCHRCGGTSRIDKQYQRIVQRAPAQTGWFPKATEAFMDSVVKNPRQFADAIKRFHLSRHVSRLTFSPDTMRVYLPDESKNWLGLDVTGGATVRWYSPTKTSYATSGRQDSAVLVTRDHVKYLDSVAADRRACLVMNRLGERACAAYLASLRPANVLVQGNHPRAFLAELRAITEKLIYVNG